MCHRRFSFLPIAPRPTAGIHRNQARPAQMSPSRRPSSTEELAFLPVTELSALIRAHQVSSMELTGLYKGLYKLLY